MNKVFYDSDCNFCRKIKSILSIFDIFKSFKWLPNKNIEKNTADKTIVLITESKKEYLEFYACRYIMTRIPVFWIIIPFLFIPYISSFLGNIIYRKISKGRHCKS